MTPTTLPRRCTCPAPGSDGLRWRADGSTLRSYFYPATCNREERRIRTLSEPVRAESLGLPLIKNDVARLHISEECVYRQRRNQPRTYLLNQSIVRCQARSAAALLYRSGVASQLKPCTAPG